MGQDSWVKNRPDKLTTGIQHFAHFVLSWLLHFCRRTKKCRGEARVIARCMESRVEELVCFVLAVCSECENKMMLSRRRINEQHIWTLLLLFWVKVYVVWCLSLICSNIKAREARATVLTNKRIQADGPTTTFSYFCEEEIWQKKAWQMRLFFFLTS